jgi:hypothetical protein
VKPLIAIISHAGGVEWRSAIRETWLKDRDAAYRFIVGAGVATDHDDELAVDAPDDYAGILSKVRRVCAWAGREHFDHVFICFTDTYVHVPRLLSSGFEHHAYLGHFPKMGFTTPQAVPLVRDELGRFAYASGGAGYWLNARAMTLFASVDPPADVQYDDLWAGWLLGMHGIAGFHDPRYGFKGWRLNNDQQITVHLSKGTGVYHPSWMLSAHANSA